MMQTLPTDVIKHILSFVPRRPNHTQMTHELIDKVSFLSEGPRPGTVCITVPSLGRNHRVIGYVIATIPVSWQPTDKRRGIGLARLIKLFDPLLHTMVKRCPPKCHYPPRGDTGYLMRAGDFWGNYVLTCGQTEYEYG